MLFTMEVFWLNSKSGVLQFLALLWSSKMYLHTFTNLSNFLIENGILVNLTGRERRLIL